MKNFAIVLGLIIGLFIAGSAYADPNDMAMLEVQAEIVPNIALGDRGDTTLSALQTGDVDGIAKFRIDANTQWVSLIVEASNLYKGTDPNSPYYIDILSGPSYIQVVGGAQPVPPVDIELTAAAANLPAGFVGLGSPSTMVESGQSGHFSQDVDIFITWNNDDPELPTGLYGGYVKLLGAVVP
jgi:hypothetical protein